jgi:hypothetical protein
MQEAWLLFDEQAIRCAAEIPAGSTALELPPLKRIESKPDPKKILEQALLDACGLNKRRRSKLNLPRCKARVADFIDDFSPLRRLNAFRPELSDSRGDLRQPVGPNGLPKCSEYPPGLWVRFSFSHI